MNENFDIRRKEIELKERELLLKERELLQKERQAELASTVIRGVSKSAGPIKKIVIFSIKLAISIAFGILFSLALSDLLDIGKNAVIEIAFLVFGAYIGWILLNKIFSSPQRM